MEVLIPIEMSIVNPIMTATLSEFGDDGILIVFSERTQGFTLDALEVIGGTVDDLIGDGLCFHCPYTKTAETMTVRIPAGAVTCEHLIDCWNVESNTLEL